VHNIICIVVVSLIDSRVSCLLFVQFGLSSIPETEGTHDSDGDNTSGCTDENATPNAPPDVIVLAGRNDGIDRNNIRAI
jgi:hypothetical protein